MTKQYKPRNIREERRSLLNGEGDYGRYSREIMARNHKEMMPPAPSFLDAYGKMRFILGGENSLHDKKENLRCFDYAICGDRVEMQIVSVTSGNEKRQGWTREEIADGFQFTWEEKAEEILHGFCGHDEAVAQMQKFVDAALLWLDENDTLHDEEGCDQSSNWVVRCLAAELSGQPEPPRHLLPCNDILPPAAVWAPTGADLEVGAICEHLASMRVFLTQTRDSEALERSNFRVAIARLQSAPDYDQAVEIHRFGHWGPGWYEAILIRPYTQSLLLAEEMADSLADYNCLDEMDYSMLESEEEAEVRDQERRMAKDYWHGYIEFPLGDDKSRLIWLSINDIEDDNADVFVTPDETIQVCQSGDTNTDARFATPKERTALLKAKGQGGEAIPDDVMEYLWATIESA